MSCARGGRDPGAAPRRRSARGGAGRDGMKASSMRGGRATADRPPRPRGQAERAARRLGRPRAPADPAGPHRAGRASSARSAVLPGARVAVAANGSAGRRSPARDRAVRVGLQVEQRRGGERGGSSGAPRPGWGASRPRRRRRHAAALGLEADEAAARRGDGQASRRRRRCRGRSGSSRQQQPPRSRPTSLRVARQVPRVARRAKRSGSVTRGVPTRQGCWCRR